MKKHFLLFVMTMLSSMASAHDIEVKNADGVTIYYKYINNYTNLEVSFRGGSYTSYSNEYTGNIVIPSEVTYNNKTYSVTSIGSYSFSGCSGLTSITIPNSVTSIGSYAFYSCSSLTSITIPNSVTSIGYAAFNYCSGLTSITIPNSVTSIGSYAFSGCSGLTSITIPNSVTSIGSNAFSGCSGLTSITIPNSVTSIGSNAFSGCSGLTSITLLCKNVGSWFSGITSIKEITLGDEVTSIGDKAFNGCSGLTSITIPNSVTNVGSSAFEGCSGLTSITIPNSVTSIGSYAFSGCSGLTSITIPNSVTSIGSNAFSGCSGLTSVMWNAKKCTDFSSYDYSSFYSIRSKIKEFKFGEEVETIPAYLCYGMSGLTSVTIGNSVTSIGNEAFRDCSGLTSVTIPNSVTSIGKYAFSECSGLTSITIPNSMTNIGEYAFYRCSGLTSITLLCKNVGSWFSGITSIKEITLGDEVTSIGDKAFNGCSGLTSITIPNSVTSIGSNAFNYCSGLTSVTIGNSVTSIGSYAFNGCSGLTSITIPNSVLSVGSSAFRYCSGLTAVTIPNSVTSIGDYAFSGCSGLTSVTIGNSVTSIGSYAFNGCSGLTSVTIGNSVTSIGERAFYYCSKLNSITIPSSVTSIGLYAFSGIASNASVTVGDDFTSISSSSFPSSTKFYTKHKTKALFALWNSIYKQNIYEQETSKSLVPPSLSSSYTQTSLNVTINNMYDEYTYELNGRSVTNSTTVYDNLYPEYSMSCTLIVRYNNISYTYNTNFSTKSLSPSVKVTTKTASSLSVNGKYSKGDAEVTKIVISLNGKTIEGDNISVTGLNPNTSYKATYTITVKTGGNSGNTRNYTASSDFKTDALTLTTQQPKVISLGNVIVAAESNVDDEEKNVGFEWRRTDWTSDFASNTGTAYLFEGTMEGYIRNLNTDKLWKFRPYYLADNGTYYYGDWIGLDPTNTSYFEPTVHTYSQIGVTGNTALVKGYALGGSDEITVQGFKYWKNAGSGSNRVSSTDIPGTANTVEASGTIMEVSLSNLDYESSYSYVAFVTTSKGTYYGEIKTFDTDSDPTGINGIKVDNATTASVHEVARYNMQGRRITTAEKGINIIKMSDGTTKKVVVK